MSILPQLILNSVIAGSVYALIALGFNLIYGTTKFFNLAHGAMAAVGGYAVLWLMRIAGGANIVLLGAVGVLVAGLVGWCLDRLIYLPLRKRRATNMVLLVASLGVFTAVQAVIAMLFTSQFQTLSQGGGDQTIYQIFGAVITQTQLIILIFALAIMIGLALMLKKTLFGKAIKAVSDDEEVAKIVGINTEKIIGRVFFIGSAIGGFIPGIWGDGAFSFASVIGNAVGGVLGIWLGFKLSKYI